MTAPETDVDSLRVGRVAAPLREQVTDVLREAILDFRFRPGERLVERDLIEKTGVSRATIREVLRQLTAEGLVTVIPQRGAVVVELTEKEAADLYEVRTMLEGLAARLFAERGSDEQVAALRERVEEIRTAFDELDSADQRIQTMLNVKDRYYDVFLDGCGNEQVRGIHEGLQARVRLMRATSLGQPDRPAQTLAEIDAVASAIEARGSTSGGPPTRVSRGWREPAPKRPPRRRAPLPERRRARSVQAEGGATTMPSASHQTVPPGWKVTPPKLTGRPAAPMPSLRERRGTAPRASRPMSIAASASASRRAPFRISPAQPASAARAAIASPSRAIAVEPPPSTTRTRPSPGSASASRMTTLSSKQETVTIVPSKARRPPKERSGARQQPSSGRSSSRSQVLGWSCWGTGASSGEGVERVGDA
jgi:DNA-binding GntR family transcriptional regulator